MRWTILLLVGCGSATTTVTAPPEDSCAVPADWSGPDCFDPGGGVQRCHMPDGSFWDRQLSGALVHWRYSSVNPDVVDLLCEVK